MFAKLSLQLQLSTGSFVFYKVLEIRILIFWIGKLFGVQKKSLTQ